MVIYLLLNHVCSFITAVGDSVQEDEVIAEIETDKVSLSC